MASNFLSGNSLRDVSTGPNLSGDESATWPTYDCRVGRQLRCQVPLSSLRPYPCPGEMVLAWTSGRWMPARFQTSYHYIGIGQVVLEDPTPNQASSLQVPFHFIRRRFFKGQRCHVYRGRDIGWADGTIEEDMCVESLCFTRLFFIIFTCQCWFGLPFRQNLSPGSLYGVSKKFRRKVENTHLCSV